MKRLLVGSVLFAALWVNICAAGNWQAVPSGSSPGWIEQLSQAHWIAAGARSTTRVVYVFSDPNCPYCNDLWKALQVKRAADVQLRYLLVAVIDDDSRAKDAAILESQDPGATFDEQERNYANGGIHGKATLQPATASTIATNERLMSALHIYGTPGLIYVDEHNQVRLFVGMPDEEQLRMIVGKR